MDCVRSQRHGQITWQNKMIAFENNLNSFSFSVVSTKFESENS